jgi:hypothetical protein
MSTCKCNEITYDPRSDRESFLCDCCNTESPFTRDTNRFLSIKMGFSVFLYKFTTIEEQVEMCDFDPDLEDYCVSFATERGVVLIFSKDEKHYTMAYNYLRSIYGKRCHEDAETVFWETSVCWET